MGAAASSLTPGSTVRDTTFRSVLFNKKDLSFVKNPDGQMILADQVSPELFKSYENFLKVMARLSRLVYSDSGIIRKVILHPSFMTTTENTFVNDAITQLDKEFIKEKRQPSTKPGAIEGRPMESYTLDFLDVSPQSKPFCHYVSTPDDCTFFVISGEKVLGLQPTDAVLVFKGSSTIDNFKHDLMSQFTPTSLETGMPLGLKMTSTVTGNTVPGSFLFHLSDSWEHINAAIQQFNPTRLFITGQSLGGAFAGLCTFILAENRDKFPNIQSFHLITFGSPTIVSDVARNTFNTHLDSGLVTLDRVVSSYSKITDVIPSLPAMFSHPGFQPLRTELYPEKQGRAYQLDKIKKVFQKGGALVLGFTQAKRDYGNQTLTHAPNLVRIPAKRIPFAHAEYFDMTWLGVFRLMGMKNPGFKINTFISDLYPEGITFKYVTSTVPSKSPPAQDPVNNKGFDEISKLVPNAAPTGGRRTYRKKKLNRRKTRK